MRSKHMYGKMELLPIFRWTISAQRCRSATNRMQSGVQLFHSRCRANQSHTEFPSGLV